MINLINPFLVSAHLYYVHKPNTVNLSNPPKMAFEYISDFKKIFPDREYYIKYLEYHKWDNGHQYNSTEYNARCKVKVIRPLPM